MELSGEQLRYGFLNNYATLVRRLSTSSIIHQVLSEGIVTSTEKAKIDGQCGENSKTGMLLDVIHRLGVADPAIFVKFYNLLPKVTAGQNFDGVLKKIKEDSESPEVCKKFQYQKKALEEGDRLALEGNKTTIVQALSVDNILPDLVSCGAVSCANKGKIMAEGTPDDQARCLYEVIYDSGSASLDMFVDVLKETDQYKALGEKLRTDREALAKVSGKHRRIQKRVIDHDLLLEDLKEICAKYETFGLNLGVPLATIKEFKQNVTGMDGLVDYCLNRVIDAWLLGEEGTVNRDYLVKAIEAMRGYPKVITEIKKQDFPIKMKNFAKILRSIRPLRQNYSSLGIQLGLTLDKIKEFERQQGDCERCLSEVLSYWLRMVGEDAPDKDTLWEALGETGNVGLAQKLKEDYREIHFPAK